MDGGVEDDILCGCEDLYREKYSSYFFVTAVIVGLLFVALYKIYVDHQRHQDKQRVHKETMREYHAAKEDVTANLIREAKETRALYNEEKFRREECEGQIRGAQVEITELKSKIHTQKRQLNDKDDEIEELNAEKLRLLKQNEIANKRIATLTRNCDMLQKKCKSIREQKIASMSQQNANQVHLSKRKEVKTTH